MFLNHRKIRVFLYGEAIDMRSGFERLSFYVREHLGGDLLEGHVYLFLGRNRKRAKAVLFDGTGLVLIHKRLEEGKFMSVEELKEVKEITPSELGLLLDGSRIHFPLANKESKDRGYPDSKARDWEEIKGLYDESQEVTVIKRTYQILVHRRKKYRFKPSIGTDKEIIVTAPGPAKLMPGVSL